MTDLFVGLAGLGCLASLESPPKPAKPIKQSGRYFTHDVLV